MHAPGFDRRSWRHEEDLEYSERGMPTRRRARQLKEQVTRFGARVALVALALALAVGCGGDDDPPEFLGAPTLTIDGSRVSISCFGADCTVFVYREVDAVGVTVNRRVGGEAVARTEVLPLSPGITDLEIELGTGNDRLSIQDYLLSGSLRVVMGDGDDEVRLLQDGGPLGTLDLDLGAGDDRAEFAPRLVSRGFRIDAGPGDDEVVIRAACFPYGSVVRGGAGMDFLFGTAKLVAQLATLDGFEERTLGFGGFAGLDEVCRDLE